MGNETKAVRVGGVWMGAGAPISVQSMTNTYTGDVEATTAQVQQLAEAGCEIVRMAVNDVPAAAAVREIRARTRVPLVADIHFDYRLAIASIENGIDKIRFNPGNIGSEANVRALVDCAKAHHVPIRIGVNAGSLDKALLARYGAPVPAALAESALSHVRILERAGFSDIVISAKISSVPETVETYRLLKQACSYPLHIGVTEESLRSSNPPWVSGHCCWKGSETRSAFRLPAILCGRSWRARRFCRRSACAAKAWRLSAAQPAAAARTLRHMRRLWNAWNGNLKMRKNT